MPPSRRLFLGSSAGLVGLGTAYASPPRLAVDPAFEPGYLKLHRAGELRRRADALWAQLESCRLCPRECGAGRLRAEKGFCGASRDVEVSSHHPHFGEERSLVGSRTAACAASSALIGRSARGDRAGGGRSRT